MLSAIEISILTLLLVALVGTFVVIGLYPSIHGSKGPDGFEGPRGVNGTSLPTRTGSIININSSLLGNVTTSVTQSTSVITVRLTGTILENITTEQSHAIGTLSGVTAPGDVVLTQLYLLGTTTYGIVTLNTDRTLVLTRATLSTGNSVSFMMVYSSP